MVGRGVGGVDVQDVHRVNRLEHALDLGPAVDAQQNLAAGGDARYGLIGFARNDRAQYVDARHQRAEVVGRPTDVGEHAIRCEGDAATSAVENLILDQATKAYPAFDAALDPQQIDTREIVTVRGAHDPFPASSRSEERLVGQDCCSTSRY